MLKPNPWIAIAVISAAALLVSCKEGSEPAASAKPAHDQADEHGHDNHGGEDEHQDEVTLTAAAVRDAGIRVEEVSKHVLSETVVAPARVSFNLEAVAHVGSPLAGRVSEVKARVGDEVKKGDLLLTIDSPDLGEAQSDFLQKRTAVATAEPAVDSAKASYERAKKLFEESGGISLAEVQKREADMKAAQGALVASKAALTAAESRLRLLGMPVNAVEALAKTSEIKPAFTIVAPISGKVIHRAVTQGELVAPDREDLLVLADTALLWVLADVAESQLAGIQIGGKALIMAAGKDAQPIEGIVTHVAASVDPAKRAAEVRIEIKGAITALKPGMFVQAQIDRLRGDGAAAQAVLAVPQGAIQTVEGETAVFVAEIEEENTFAKRTVKVGKAVGRMVPILEGLEEGEEVVVAGSFTLKADLGKAGAAHEH